MTDKYAKEIDIELLQTNHDLISITNDMSCGGSGRGTEQLQPPFFRSKSNTQADEPRCEIPDEAQR